MSSSGVTRTAGVSSLEGEQGDVQLVDGAVADGKPVKWNNTTKRFEDATADLNGTYAALAQQPINVLSAPYSVDRTGATNAVPGILAACQAALAANGQNRPSRSVYVPAGVYLLGTTLDFSTLDPAAAGITGGAIEGFTFTCDPGALFVTLAGGGFVNLAPPAGWQFLACAFRFGSLHDPSHTIGNGLVLQSINDSTITALDVSGFATSGVICDPGTTAFGIFNNYIDIRRLTGNTFGFATVGQAMPSIYGFQGNEVHLGQVASNGSTGVNVDANGTGHNTQWNTFFLGAVENNSVGISDACGDNVYYVGNTNSNGAAGFQLAAGATFTPYVRGRIQDSINLNGQKADLVNAAETLGRLAAPAVPSSTVAQANNFQRPVMVYVAGGTVTGIAVGGQATGLTGGSFRLLPGETIALTYTAAPTWQWFGTN